MKTAIVNIGRLVTCIEGDSPMPPVVVLRDVSIVFEDGEIHEIVEAISTEADQVVDAEGGVVTPGFVDAHTHLVFAGNRSRELDWKAQGKSYADIAHLGGGILNTVKATRDATEDELFAQGLKHLTWCLRNGTTTLEAKSGYGLDLQTELHILLATHKVCTTYSESVNEVSRNRIVPTFLGLHAVPPEFEDKEDYVHHMVEEVLPVVAGAGLARYADAFVEEGYFDHEDAKRLAEKAKSLGIGLRLHVDQMKNGGGAELASEIGATTADHLEHTDSTGIAAMTKTQTQPVLLPGSVYGLGLDRFPEARKMIGAGLSVVLATDFNPGSSPTPSIPFVWSLATRYMKMTPEECLAASTVNAAKSLGFHDRGRLAPGQKADFCVWPLQDWEEIAMWIDGPRPSQVWVNGTKVV